MSRNRRFNPLIAGLLSFFFPGLGQLYKGQFWAALLWFLVTSAGYWMLVIPGVILHFFCVVNAVVGGAKD